MKCLLNFLYILPVKMLKKLTQNFQSKQLTEASQRGEINQLYQHDPDAKSWGNLSL